MMSQLANTFRAFLLCEPDINTEGEAWLLSGEASGVEAGAGLLSVRTISRFDPIIRPLYAARARFWDVHREKWLEQIQRNGAPEHAAWFERWLEIDSFLNAARCRRSCTTHCLPMPAHERGRNLSSPSRTWCEQPKV
jgi:hypothetical protein